MEQFNVATVAGQQLGVRAQFEGAAGENLPGGRRVQNPGQQGRPRESPMSVQEIIAAIDALPAEERRQVYAALLRKGRTDPEVRLSAHDLAQHLISEGSGRHDVSTNKAYLADLGRSSLS